MNAGPAARPRSGGGKGTSRRQRRKANEWLADLGPEVVLSEPRIRFSAFSTAFSSPAVVGLEAERDGMADASRPICSPR